MSTQITVHLTKAQLTKLSKEQNIRVSYKALTGQNTTLDLSESMAKKIQAAIRKGKGIQIIASEVEAGAEIVSGQGIGRAFKKIGNAIKNTANAGAKYVHKNAGNWAEQAKKAIPKEVVQEITHSAIQAGLTAAATFTGQPELLALAPAANKLADKGVDATYKHDFRKPLPTKRQALRYIGKQGINMAKNYAEDQLNINFPDDMPRNGRDAMRKVGRAGRQYAQDYYDDVQHNDANNDGFYFEEYEGGSLVSGLIAKSYNPVAQNLLNRFGNEVITRMQIVRTPLAAPLTTAINFASGGRYNKLAAQDAAGKFFHLNANVTLQNGKVLTAEKTEVVTLKDGGTPTRGAEVMDATVPAGLTLRQLFDNTQRIQGSKYFLYSASSNNCQYFLRDMLIGSRMDTPALIDFAKQATEDLFRGNSGLRKLANTATDVAAVANNVMTNKYVAPYVPAAPNFKAPSKKTTVMGAMKRGLFGGSAMPLGGSARPLGSGFGPDDEYDGGRFARGSTGDNIHEHMAKMRAARKTKEPKPPKAPSQRKGRFAKGSQEAKDHMASIRGKRAVKGSGYLAL